MYITRDKIFMHMVKTGGSSVFRSLIDSNVRVDYNQKHYGYQTIPNQYRDYPKYMIVRDPIEWYTSFYNYFSTRRFMHFLFKDEENNEISLDQFILNSMNMKSTLLRDLWMIPQLASIVTRHNAGGNFIGSYFTSALVIGDLTTFDQFDKSLYAWFYDSMGGDDVTKIPLDNIADLGQIFGIEIDHTNKTEIPDDVQIIPDGTINVIKSIDKKYFDIISEYQPINN